MKPTKPKKAVLFIGLISNKEELFKEVKEKLVYLYGEVIYETEIFNWDFTNYYEGELGKNLKKQFLFFKKLIDIEEIVDIKMQTNKIEDKYSKNNKRLINIDPGYLTENKVVLPSAKDRPHKIYIKDGIYCDPVLKYQNNSYQPFEHSFPDFKTKKYIELFNKIRKTHIEKFIK